VIENAIGKHSTKTTCELDSSPGATVIGNTSVHVSNDVRVQIWVEPRENSLVPMRTVRVFCFSDVTKERRIIAKGAI
jgi:hypothetical protein